MADYTESSNGSLTFRIAAAGGGGHIFEVRSCGAGTPQFTVHQDKSILVAGDFLRDSVQAINNTNSSTDIAQFQSSGSTVASIAKDGTGVFSTGGAQIPYYAYLSLPASGAPGDIVLWDNLNSGGASYHLYIWDASGAAWTPLNV